MNLNPNYEIRVTDARSRDLDRDHVEWELDGGREVHVTARYTDDQHPRTNCLHPAASVKIIGSDGGDFAVVKIGSGAGLMEPATVPAFIDVLTRANAIARETDDRLAREWEEAAKADAAAGVF